MGIASRDASPAPPPFGKNAPRLASNMFFPAQEVEVPISLWKDCLTQANMLATPDCTTAFSFSESEEFISWLQALSAIAKASIFKCVVKPFASATFPGRLR